jgi:hypothetical protein
VISEEDTFVSRYVMFYILLYPAPRSYLCP